MLNCFNFELPIFFFEYVNQELDSETIGELAEILDSPSKGWAKLADSFGMFQSMGAVIMKQTSPTTYLLENLDVSFTWSSYFIISYHQNCILWLH